MADVRGWDLGPSLSQYYEPQCELTKLPARKTLEQKVVILVKLLKMVILQLSRRKMKTAFEEN